MSEVVSHLPFLLETCYDIFLPSTYLLHDLISRVFLRSLQNGIVVLGFLDAFVYAHHKHRFDSASAGNFGDCLRGRVRFMTAIIPAYAHAYQTICLAMHFPSVPRHTFRLPKNTSEYPFLPNERSITRVMFGRVVTTEAHLAFTGSRTHSNNTAEMTTKIEALSFLGPHGPVARDEQSCIYYDSEHAAGVCLGTIQARTHVQLALACQQSVIRAQHRLQLTMQHVFGHGGNLGNECADHAAALGTFGLISSHNVATRWTRHNFDTSVRFDGCNNISETLERLQLFRTNVAPSHQDRVQHWYLSSLGLLCTSRHLSLCAFLCSFFCGSEISAFSALLICQQEMDRRSSSMSTESRRRCSSSLGTSVHGVSNWYGTIVTPVTSTCCSAKQTYVSVCMQKRSLYATGKWFPKNIPISVSWSCHLVLCSQRLGSLRSTFTYRQLLTFMCLVFIYRLRHAITKSHTSHSLLFVLALLCLFWWQASSWLGRRFEHQIPNVHRAIMVGEDGTLDGLRRSARSAVCTSASRFRLVTCPDCVLTL